MNTDCTFIVHTKFIQSYFLPEAHLTCFWHDINSPLIEQLDTKMSELPINYVSWMRNFDVDNILITIN